MQRSSRPSVRSHARRLAAVGTTVLAAGVLAAAPAAAGVSAHGGSDGYRDGSTRTTTAPTPKPSEQPRPTRGGPTATAAYVYLKLDPSKGAYWENSGQQYLVAAWEGAEWRNITWEQIRDAVPVEVCGAGWAVQEDAAYGGTEVFTDSEAPHYPDGVLKWTDKGGPLFDADHWDLEEHVGAVPDCAPTYPVPTPTPTPSVPPVPTPTPTVTQSGPTPSATPTTTPSAVPAPTSSATPAPTTTPTSEVLAATPRPTPSATVRSEVLAAGDAALATTGSTVLPVAIGAGVLVAAGGVLVALRQRRRSNGSDA
ncbi:hypothetical protein [Cellulomonas fimi]|uniref:LPXTG-motif cell wall anchor domain protein n=1 Tax=Cellulomonas fimi (strain ATCC 484 / DSM 20113 / JCM 1341 / CCUG 24087 / LMG 16345 / NBRC 15513 / NCIMB 8980 / NCTC 7547 / NRS-133) TaxID=590998 RepID=F4H1Z1_CELFA|nr:hypothetical protein [Cellulomonas fimi]AEE45161.1 LPXTG-motif cell wall anchor domain protein [Cellulomonas fimi ATCC 484]NNH06276.1 hypothetical protein [Cellulomonas fimi]VEH28423.1 Uncharacterised protein [Cellulomonas fimi]